MCNLSPLNDRNTIVNKFPISDRKPSYDTLDKAIKDALFFAFKDINFRTLHKNKLGENISEFFAIFNKKTSNEKENKKTVFIESLKELNIDTTNIESEKSENRTLSPEDIEAITTVVNNLSNQTFTITNFLIGHLSKVGFVKRFKTYFDNNKDYSTEESFDAWHHYTCQEFMKVLSLYYKDAAYGKAQKIVNMTFKHLYCMKIQNEFLSEDCFRYCHLTLDSFTLEWFRREVVQRWYNVNYDKTIHISTAREGAPFPKWSNLSYRNPQKLNYNVPEDRHIEKGNFYHYMFFESLARECIAKKKLYGGCTIFQAEFYAWPEIQVHLALEALFGQSIGQKAMIALLDDKLESYEKDFKNDDAISELVSKYKKDKSTNSDEEEADALKRNFDNAKNLFRLLPLKEKTCYIYKKMEIINEKL